MIMKRLTEILSSDKLNKVREITTPPYIFTFFAGMPTLRASDYLIKGDYKNAFWSGITAGILILLATQYNKSSN